MTLLFMGSSVTRRIIWRDSWVVLVVLPVTTEQNKKYNLRGELGLNSSTPLGGNIDSAYADDSHSVKYPAYL